MKRSALFLVAGVFALGGLVFAGGPSGVTGPASPQQGVPYTWDPAAMPIRYTLDSGPLSVDPFGNIVMANPYGAYRVAKMFETWQSVPTAAISFQNAGPISAPGLPTNPDIQTVADYNTALAACQNGTQTPVIFDANGSIIAGLGLDPAVIGFSGICSVDSSKGHIASALVLLNGIFQDGIDAEVHINGQVIEDYEITGDEFDQAITHELGHFIGLDHSQINVEVLRESSPSACKTDDVAGLPLMFPFLYCQDRVSLGLPKLAPDDIAWVSKLYPGKTYASSYGMITGTIYFPDGVTPVQGINVIARQVDDLSTPQDESKTNAVSVVSGFLFTGNPGQPFTGSNFNGNPFGSRDVAKIGYYEMSVPPGTYIVQVENIYYGFTGGSSVGPLDVPSMVSADRHWAPYQSPYDDIQRTPITVQAGQTVSGIDITLMGQPQPRFDQFEDGALTRPWNLFKQFWANLFDHRNAG